MARPDSPPRTIARPKSGDLFLGVDGGQSHTRAVVGDSAGAVIGRGEAGRANHAGDERSREKLRRAISDAVGVALERTGRKLGSTQFAAASLGLSGGPADNRAIIESIISTRKLDIVTDAEIALLGGMGGKPGVVVVAGTGSMAFGKNAAGETARAGGWGYVFGDEGGASGIVRHALRAALRQEEGWGPETALTGLLLKECGAQTVNELMHSLYSERFPRDRVASLAPLVGRAASDGDRVAAEILRAAGDCLQGLAMAVRKQLFAIDDAVPIVPVGGVFRSRFVAEEFRRRLEGQAGNSVVQPKFEPVMGALVKAYDLAGMDVPVSLR